MAVSPLIAGYDQVLLDLDGCVWVGDLPTQRAAEAVTALRAEGIRLAFLTNDARHGEEDFVRKLWRLGFQASLAEVVTVGGAIQFHLAEHYPGGGSAFVIGAAALRRHVADAGLRIVNGSDLAEHADVVVAAADESVDYAMLRTATQTLLNGAELVGAGRDATFPMPDGPWPGSGAVLAALEYASGREARTVGKPDPEIFRTAVDRLGPGRTLVIGDRLDSDLAGAQAAGLDGAIVLSGVTDRSEAEAHQPPPKAIATTLAELVLGPDTGAR